MVKGGKWGGDAGGGKRGSTIEFQRAAPAFLQRFARDAVLEDERRRDAARGGARERRVATAVPPAGVDERSLQIDARSEAHHSAMFSPPEEPSSDCERYDATRRRKQKPGQSSLPPVRDGIWKQRATGQALQSSIDKHKPNQKSGLASLGAKASAVRRSTLSFANADDDDEGGDSAAER
mmetsp:Transcript_11621/g.31303  ORF Transcript_11621/g.31303 Transcript_11621/m.31303 type:complete len:179 (-) Transcript_11621:561-1097(-)